MELGEICVGAGPRSMRGRGSENKTVAYSRRIYLIDEDIHANSVEGFWGRLKRPIDGAYYHVTPEHLQGYTDEYSHRKDEQPMFKTMLRRVVESDRGRV